MPTPSHRKYCAPSPTAQPRDRTHSLAWRALRDRTTGSGGMPTLCVLGCLAMARYRRYAFPGARRWQDMCEMRFRATGSGKIPPRYVPGRQSGASFALHASQKRSRTGKSPVRGKIRAPCIRKRAGLGRICAPCIRNAPQTAFRERTARRSCQEGALFAARAPLNHARREDLAIVRRMRGKDQAENAYVLSKTEP